MHHRAPPPPAAAYPPPFLLPLQLHLREKQELFEANSALRQVLRRRGVADAAVDAELALINRQVGAVLRVGLPLACCTCLPA